MTHIKSIKLLFLFALFGHCTANAADYHSPRTTALAGSGHAAPLLTDALYLNPSFVSFLKTYGISASYLWQRGMNESYKGRYYNLSIQDGRTELFQAGLGLTVKDEGILVSVGASKSFVERFGVGMGSKFLFTDGFGSELAVSDFSLSTSFVAMPWLQFALILDNVMEVADGLRFGYYRELTLGAKINVMQVFLIYADPHWTPELPVGENLGYNLGLEFPVMSDLFLRGGHFYNAKIPSLNRYGTGIGLGLGWTAPRLSIDYAFQRIFQTNDGIVPASVHTFGATIYF